MSVTLVPALRVQSWLRKMNKQIIQSSKYEALSNRAEESILIPNGDKSRIPDAVCHYVSDKFTPGVQSTTIPSMDKLNRFGQGGQQPVDGNEEKPKLRLQQIFYNVQRKGLTIKNESVDGDMTDAYPIMEQRVELLTDYFTELNEYNKDRANILGYDIFQTAPEFWTGDSITTPPATDRIHPYILYRGAPAPVTYNNDQDVYTTNIQTAIASQTSATTFTRDALDKIISYASRNVRKLGWKSGNDAVHWVIALTSVQADQLISDTSAGNWTDLFKEAGARGINNRAITSMIGIYRKACVVVADRQPLYNADNSFSGTFQDRWQFARSGEVGVDANWDDQRVRTEKTTANTSTGTMEVAQIMGRGAFGCASIKELNFNGMGKDYDFSEGFEARWSRGDTRMDFVTSVGSTDRPKNWSSFLYLTPSPQTVY